MCWPPPPLPEPQALPGAWSRRATWPLDRVSVQCPHPFTPGAEQTEKADVPREPPPVEPKPDPTSGMAAAEAEAVLSESLEQGTATQLGPSLTHPLSCIPPGPSPTYS